MRTDPLLSRHIKTIDHFFFGDVWSLINRDAVIATVESATVAEPTTTDE